ncbi:hypothetical protein X943_002922 [Babesia divergens]|uniref:Uncharacterized protein n=1 Tax=Babesia divergens TaxID=32595 RepID=A0AAD9GEM2_BABDI|nr:hypothetical protein X943_002922 [Babesia divergens]
MAPNTVIPTEYITQWYNGNYEVIHSCMHELCKAVDADQNKSGRLPATSPRSVSFWSRFWGRSKPNDVPTTGIPKNRHFSDDVSDSRGHEDVTLDGSDNGRPSSMSDPAEGEISHESLEKLKRGVIMGFRESVFHLPHMVPRRKGSMSLDEVRAYIRGRFPSIEKSAEQIDSFSTLTNIDQELCCELLYEGICFYGEESQMMSEPLIIENMLHAQSSYQLKSLVKLFSLFNSNMTMSTDTVSDAHVFPESFDILNDLVSKGLVKNMCLLLMASIKEAARYHSMSSSDSLDIGTLLYMHTVELINSVLCLLEMYFLRFHPVKDDIKRLMVLVPHVFNINGLLEVSDYNSAMETLFDGLNGNTSAWYPPSVNVISFWIGVREFDELSNNICNMSNRISLILMLALHPQHYRLSISDSSSGTLYASLMSDTHFLDRFKALDTPFSAHNHLDVIMEFIVFGMYFKDMDRAIKCIDLGVFEYLGVNMVDGTNVEQQATVVQVLELMLHLFLFKDGALNKSWYDILDYEIISKRHAEDYARTLFTGVIDEKVYRQPGRSLMDLLGLLTKFGEHGNKTNSFQIWKSCAEVYRSVIPNVSCHLYKYNSFENPIYNCNDTTGVDSKTIDRLIVPCEGFSWWERNSALLELVTLAAGDRNICVETYPRYLTCLLNFGIYLSRFDNIRGEAGGHAVGQFLSTGSSRELRFPFLLERIIYQIGSLTKGYYSTLPSYIYERLLARDDQIETAEATLEIASSIPAQYSQQNLSVGGCLRKMYTFPLISGVTEVKVALCTLGLGGLCPYGLIEAAIATFQLISHCDRIPRNPVSTESVRQCLNVNIQYKAGGDQSFLNAVFSILSRSHVEGMETLTSSVLSSLCSTHINDAATAASALSRISELLHDADSTLSRGFVQKSHRLSIDELRAFINCVKNLFLYIPRKERFTYSHVDWLHRLVEFALWILDTHCLRNECVHWHLISDVFEFLLEVAQGPIDAQANTSRASQYLIEQLLIPASTACISLVRAANEAKLLSAVSMICILFKRDVLLIVAHRASLFLPIHSEGDRCQHCGLQYAKDSGKLVHKSDGYMDVDPSSNSFQWWSNKLRKINSIFSSIQSHESSVPQKTCECIKIEMRPVSLLMAHDALIEAMATLRTSSDHLMDSSSRCDFIGYFDDTASDELKIKCVYLLLQMQERMGIECLMISSKVIKELQRYYGFLRPCEDHTRHVMYPMMEADDLMLYNKLTSMVTNSNRMENSEHWYYCMSHLSDLNRCGLDNLILFLLKQCAIKASLSGSSTNLGFNLLGSEAHIVSLIKLASGGNATWCFSDSRRMDALASLVSFAKVYPLVSRLVIIHWRNIEDDVNKFDFARLNYESYIMQCQRLSYILELLVVLADQGTDCVVLCDITSYVKFYCRFVKTMCEVTASMRGDLEPFLKNAVEGADGIGIDGFLQCWKRASFQSNVCLSFNLQLGTKLLNPEASESVHKAMRSYALRLNCSNTVLTSSTALISCLLNFISQCGKFNILDVGEKSRNWLELASAEFNPDETSELKLVLHVALIKQLVRVWLNNNGELRGNDSMLAISIVLKLVTFVLTRETSTQLRSKIYACINLLLTNQLRVHGPKTSELLVAHLLSQSFDLQGLLMQNRPMLLQILFQDATSMAKELFSPQYPSKFEALKSSDQTKVLLNVSDTCDTDMGDIPTSSMGTDPYYKRAGLRHIVVGTDYTTIDTWNVEGRNLDDIVNLEGLRSNEMLYIAADCGVRIDHRVESLMFLSAVINALQKFEATAVEYELGTVSYGSLGVISTEDVSTLINNRIQLFKRCKQCLLHSPCCPSCIELLTSTACALNAASGLQQFSTFWFHVQPTSASTCLADLFLSCNLLLGFSKACNLPIELFHPFISILENLLCMPSVKTRNALIKWLNRHSDILGSLLTIKDDLVPSEEKVSLICSLLRIYRVCMLWLLAEYRSTKSQKHPMSNFSLIMADLHCNFPLAVTVPRVIPPLLDVLTRDLSNCTDVYWQCVLLCLQTVFPELGGFEADLDFSMQTPIMSLAIEKAPTVMAVLARCGTNLLGFIKQVNNLSPNLKRQALGRFALRAATVECAATLLEYILALVLTHNSASTGDNVLSKPSNEQSNDLPHGTNVPDMIDMSGSNMSSGMVPKLKKLVAMSKVELVLDKIARVCEANGACLDQLTGNRRKHVLGDNLIEYLAPYDLEHVQLLGNVQQYKYSYKSLYALLLSSVCNTAIVLEQYYGCKFSSQILSSDQLNR